MLSNPPRSQSSRPVNANGVVLRGGAYNESGAFANPNRGLIPGAAAPISRAQLPPRPLPPRDSSARGLGAPAPSTSGRPLRVPSAGGSAGVAAGLGAASSGSFRRGSGGAPSASLTPLEAAAPAAPAAAASSGPIRSLSSQRYNPVKCADPFQSNPKKCRTSFSAAYLQGNIPARLQSSAAKFQVQWDSYAASGFSPDLLVVCADGLCELEHPFVVMAPMMFQELIGRAQSAPEMLAPVIEPVTAHIRKAMLTENTTMPALQALVQLAGGSGPLLLPALGKLVPVLAKPMKDKRYRDLVAECFSLFEQNCGPEATKIIKSKIPTYS